MYTGLYQLEGEFSFLVKTRIGLLFRLFSQIILIFHILVFIIYF